MLTYEMLITFIPDTASQRFSPFKKLSSVDSIQGLINNINAIFLTTWRKKAIYDQFDKELGLKNDFLEGKRFQYMVHFINPWTIALFLIQFARDLEPF